MSTDKLQGPAGGAVDAAPETSASKSTGTSHTPGPWFHGDVPGGVAHGYARTVRMKPEGAGWTIPIADITVSDEAEANARLIAAAPDLLAALKECVACWAGTRDVIGATVKAKLARADAAIAKAEGPSVAEGSQR